MKRIIYLTAALLLSGSAYSQICTQTIAPHVVSQGIGNFHITADTTMPFNDGSNFYVCAGVHLTMTGSAGSNYILEDGASLTLMDHDGDNVFAKGNCTIVDNSTETLVINAESTTTISKPNDPFNYVFLTCPSMVYDYSQVGGSAPCGVLSIEEQEIETVNLYPNPMMQNAELNFSVEVKDLVIVDLSGREVMSIQGLNQSSVVLNELDKGIFIARIETLNGTVLSNRFIVE